ncbi:unnamed protein product [Effrenium voratum]|uniref:Uncharacterized protein n=1 Tax=Effrenium voratum TaxID=2562239 RepID=A0AA36NAB9_9DINO|nr:unnamed protein product [Effrenium voratum]
MGRACVAQKLGATALTNAARKISGALWVYQLLTNFAAPGCTVPGVHAEVLVPRMVLQVRGTKCEVVCGLRITGHLQEGQRPATSEEGGGSSAENESGTETADDPSGTSSDLAETQEMCVDWSPWILKAQEKQVPRLDITRRPKSPKVVVTELHVEEGQGLSPRLRPRKWWAEPSGAAERLLPEGVAAKPQKLPLIGELRAWRPKADLERGLQRSWGREKPAEPRLPQIGSKVAPAPQMWVLAPQTARAQMLKSVDCHMLKKSHWLWCFLLEGGPRPPSVPATVEEKLCCLQEHFERLYSQVERSCFAQWVTLNSASESQNRPMRTGSYTGGGGCLRPPQWKAVEKPQSAQPEFLHAATCEHCQGPLVRQDLEGSMMALVWKTPVCILCLRCGFGKPDDGTRAEMLSEQVLEVTTSLLVRPGQAEQLQRCIVRVLRLENNCCCVAMPREASSTRPTRSLSRVASVSFAAPSAAMAAAATVVKRSQLDAHERRSRPFACDESWITNSLADTGLDLYYGKVRQLSVEVALEELDDKRMLRLRQEVSPMLLWLELAYVLSPEFSLILWNRALIEVFGSVTLPAAILMRMNINRLRHVAGVGPIPTQDPDTAAPARWPLKLHRVLLAPAPTWQETLAVAMEGSGLIHGGLEALFQMGQSFQEQHYSGADEAFAKEMVEGMQDVDKTSVNTIMTILSKTRSAFGSNPRALLQARRILKRKQVFLFLRGLYETIVAGHGAKEWLRVGTQQGEESDDSSNSDFKDEEERACDDEDLRIHAPVEVERQMEKQNHPQGLTIIKVLGHFSEYIHFSQMALMCIQVLGEMLRAALRLKESTVRPRGSNLASDAAQSVVLEQVILNHNFVPTALRALYRHPSSPDIVKETLTLLKYLVNEDAGHNEHVQARQQLSSPPLKPLTLMLTVSKLSDLEDRGNLLLCLQVYLIIAQDGQGKPVVSLPPEREPEAALIMTTVFKAHFHDQAVVELMLKILQLSCEQPQLCRRLFEQGLTGVLRSFLRKARRGKVHDSWFEDVKTRRGMKVAGGKGIGSLKRAKEIAQAQLRVTEALRRAEKRCWQMLRKLAVNTAGLQGLGSEVDPNYRADASKSIAQALQEMREERGPQWLLAVEYLEAVLVYDLASHGHFFAEQGGLALVMAELPYGQVDAVYPLLVAVLRLQLRRIPAAPQSHVLSDTEEVDRRRSDSFPRCRDAELRPLAQRVGKRRKSAPDFEHGREHRRVPREQCQGNLCQEQCSVDFVMVFDAGEGSGSSGRHAAGSL